MEISVNKIKGAFWGGILGESLVRYGANYQQHTISDIPLSFTIALTGMESISNCYEIEQKSWLTYLANENRDYLKYKGSLNLAQTAIVITPIIFYRYDNPTQLNLDLQTAIKLWLKSELNVEVLTLWTLIVRKICQGKINLFTDLSSIFDNQENLTQELKKNINIIQEKISNQDSISELEAKLINKVSPELLEIYQAIYCFFSLPDDFYLSLQRSTRFKKQPDLTGILTGFLLGLNNGYLAIPHDDRKYLESQNFSQSTSKLISKFWMSQQGYYSMPLG